MVWPITSFVRFPRYRLMIARYGVMRSVSAAVPTLKASLCPPGDHVGDPSDSFFRGNAARVFSAPSGRIT